MKRNDQTRTPLVQALKEFKDRRPVYFCIPGHRFQRGIPRILTDACDGNIADFDVTEAPGLDDLHHAEGVIREAQELLAGAFGADQSRFLINGTTCGIEAAVLACTGPGEKILIPRNVHRSVISALILNGAIPVWMSPEYEETFGFASTASPEAVRAALVKEPGIRAVLIVSPTYYGTFAPVREIAGICHKAGVPLIVDEAHGGHLVFSDAEQYTAMSSGADVSVMSAHKTLFSFGQSSFLHWKEGLVSGSRMDSALRMLMSSSPSYMLMASLDAARAEAAVNGRQAFCDAEDLAFELRRQAEGMGYNVLGGSSADSFNRSKSDPTRVVISACASGLSGIKMGQLLFERFHIAVEMTDARNIVLVVTAANSEEDVLLFTKALSALKEMNCETDRIPDFPDPKIFTGIPKSAMTPRDAWFSPHETVGLDRACGRIAGESIVVYPPGCAILVPGEIAEEKSISLIRKCLADGLTLINGSGKDPAEMTVVKE